jgi:hypothetical protein
MRKENLNTLNVMLHDAAFGGNAEAVKALLDIRRCMRLLTLATQLAASRWWRLSSNRART